MKSNLVIADGQLGLVISNKEPIDTNPWIEVYILGKNHEEAINPDSVYYVDLPIVNELDKTMPDFP